MCKRLIKITAIILAIAVCFCGCNFGGEKVYSLSNKNSNEKTNAIYNYICQTYGEKVLTGQQESTWIEFEHELKYIESSTGQLPAIYGFDYMNDDFDGVNKRATEWSNKGGIVTICWHTGCDFVGEWKDSQEDEIADWSKIFENGSEENKAFLAGMDKGAKALKQLQDNGVTVLWRPFHEFDGAWFWWGKGGSDNFVKLWQMMYDRYTNYWGLNNLIWVLGYSHAGENQKDWYPGDEYCDIVGADSYEGGAQSRLYRIVKSIPSDNKPICFHECGENPTTNQLKFTKWAYFMTWHTTYLTDTNSPQQLNQLYNSDIAVTLEQLPEF